MKSLKGAKRHFYRRAPPQYACREAAHGTCPEMFTCARVRWERETSIEASTAKSTIITHRWRRGAHCRSRILLAPSPSSPRQSYTLSETGRGWIFWRRRVKRENLSKIITEMYKNIFQCVTSHKIKLYLVNYILWLEWLKLKSLWVILKSTGPL